MAVAIRAGFEKSNLSIPIETAISQDRDWISKGSFTEAIDSFSNFVFREREVPLFVT
jgi:hypothetical protein